MRLIILVLLLWLPALVQAKPYDFHQCGVNRDEAMTNLATALVADISSRTRQKITSRRFLGIDLSSRDDQHEQEVSTTLKLTGVKVERENKQYCAYLNRDDLLQSAKNYYQQSRNYQIKNLPQQVRPRIDTLEQWLQDLEQIRLLGILFASEFPQGWQKKLQRQVKTLTDERSGLHPQAITIRVNNKRSKIYLAGKIIQSGEDRYLPIGDYQYRVTTPGFCEVSGEVTLDSRSDEKVQIDLDDYRLPMMQLGTNKPKQVQLMVDGKRRQAGESFTIERCDGEISVVATFRDGRTQSEDRSYRLEPGADIEDYFRFYSARDLRDLQQLADQFSSGSRLEIKYGYSYVPDEVETVATDEFDGLHQTRINYLFMNKWLRHGPGIMVAQAKGKYSGDILYNLGLQLTNVGKGQPLHIYGTVAFVPFINMQLGVGYHEYASEDGERFIHNFPEKAEDEDEDFARDFLVARLGGGLDISLSKWVGIQLFADQSFTQEKTAQAGIGLTLKMP
ncbi:MAG: hypothetical protein MK185_06875 [Saccharospirillaceae bacterium]|nr:hypothetical protein A3759_12035 [Thalassolituus sp. HI0120]MCH2040339.1 hypothetical protein [Saccharospirillaceae bacterium]